MSSTWIRATNLYDRLLPSYRCASARRGVCSACAGLKPASPWISDWMAGDGGSQSFIISKTPNPSPVRHYTDTIRSFTYYQPLHYNWGHASRARPRNAHFFRRPPILDPRVCQYTVCIALKPNLLVSRHWRCLFYSLIGGRYDAAFRGILWHQINSIPSDTWLTSVFHKGYQRLLKGKANNSSVKFTVLDWDSRQSHPFE